MPRRLPAFTRLGSTTIPRSYTILEFASGKVLLWPKIRCKHRPPRAASQCPVTEPFFKRNTRRSWRRSKLRLPPATNVMRHNDKVNNSAVGLDVGTSRICLAQRVGEEYQYETQLNAFVTIPFSKMTENVLKKEKVPHTVNGPEIVVHGNESDRFADLLNVETRRTMDKGALNPAEADSLGMLRKIVESLLDPVKDRQKICFTVPAAPLGAEDNLTYHEATLPQILNDMGYDVKSINEGLAVVYSELESSNYTGIGISCGGGLCNVCVAYLSVPVLSFSIPKAGDYIDSSAASITGERANRVRIVK